MRHWLGTGRVRIKRVNSFDDWFRRFDPDHEHIDRLKFLSDGVFAIALTLLALEIRPPDHWDGQVPTLLAELFAPLLSYAVGFFILGTAWSQQRRALALLAGVDATTTSICLLFLGIAGLIPAAVSFQIRYPQYPATLLLYSGAIVALSCTSTLFWWYVAILRPQLKPGLSPRYRWGHLAMLVLANLGIGAAMIGLAPELGRRWTLGAIELPWIIIGLALNVVAMAVRAWYRRPWPSDVSIEPPPEALVPHPHGRLQPQTEQVSDGDAERL